MLAKDSRKNLWQNAEAGIVAILFFVGAIIRSFFHCASFVFVGIHQPLEPKGFNITLPGQGIGLSEGVT
ncbi:hypothetical protein ACOZB2_22565 [Pantoea endophytica]